MAIWSDIALSPTSAKAPLRPNTRITFIKARCARKVENIRSRREFRAKVRGWFIHNCARAVRNMRRHDQKLLGGLRLCAIKIRAARPKIKPRKIGRFRRGSRLQNLEKFAFCPLAAGFGTGQALLNQTMSFKKSKHRRSKPADCYRSARTNQLFVSVTAAPRCLR